ncbi:MAG: hypothetical protein HKM98_04155 [Gammaproteobacteria bacterium]|nr:hypothetical protein [Gammaproteobacteria bacterium]
MLKLIWGQGAFFQEPSEKSVLAALSGAFWTTQYVVSCEVKPLKKIVPKNSTTFPQVIHNRLIFNGKFDVFPQPAGLDSNPAAT